MPLPEPTSTLVLTDRLGNVVTGSVIYECAMKRNILEVHITSEDRLEHEMYRAVYVVSEQAPTGFYLVSSIRLRKPTDST
jgi:hypothetical protein